MNNGDLMALNASWLELTTTAQNSMVQTGGYPSTGGYVPTTTTTVDNCYLGNTYYQPWSYPVYVTSPSRPIKLKLSEIERLRKAARADKALKDILAKFTHQIEITVDFD
jgi:hypothetical protein